MNLLNKFLKISKKYNNVSEQILIIKFNLK